MRFVAGLILVLTALVDGFPQKVEDGWKGLLPYTSTRADIEKVVGKGEKDKYNLLWKYVSSEAAVEVRYAGDPCGDKASSFEVPPETAITYWVTLKHAVPIEDLSFDRNRFARYPSSEDRSSTSFYYYQAKENLSVVPNEWGGHGIELSGELIGGREYITSFRYGPPWSELYRSPCVKSLTGTRTEA
jgi:hypothetical protein